jgi:magnesium chelatase subunit D
MSAGRSAWQRALMAATLFGITPLALGVRVRARAGAVRERWLAIARELAPAPWLRVPHGVGADRLLGGLDLAATLASGKPVLERGLLAAADGGVVVLAMVERLEPRTAALIAAALDRGEVVL